MRHTELTSRLEDHLGAVYAPVWADRFVMAELGGRTVSEALAAGVTPKEVWAAVHRSLGLPASER